MSLENRLQLFIILLESAIFFVFWIFAFVFWQNLEDTESEQIVYRGLNEHKQESCPKPWANDNVEALVVYEVGMLDELCLKGGLVWFSEDGENHIGEVHRPWGVVEEVVREEVFQDSSLPSKYRHCEEDVGGKCDDLSEYHIECILSVFLVRSCFYVLKDISARFQIFINMLMHNLNQTLKGYRPK